MLKESPEFSSKFPGSIIVGPSTTRPKTKSLEYLSQYVGLLLYYSSVFCCINQSISQSVKYLITELFQGKVDFSGQMSIKCT